MKREIRIKIINGEDEKEKEGSKPSMEKLKERNRTKISNIEDEKENHDQYQE
jgi:hypothetical protein